MLMSNVRIGRKLSQVYCFKQCVGAVAHNDVSFQHDSLDHKFLCELRKNREYNK
jgi:hypothetical protein